MTASMEMSLDDIIKQNKTTKSRRGSGSFNRSGRGGQRRGGGGGGGSNFRGRRPGGGVIRGRGRGGIVRNTSFRPRTTGGGTTSGPRKFGSIDTTKLIVSNLDFGVTDSDILELFSEFGPLKSAGVHYDRSGRSLGTADLIFERRSDAIKAMKQYNGVPLDGREMKIQLATSDIPSFRGRVGVRGGAGTRFAGGFKPRGGTFNRRGGRGGRGAKRGGTAGAKGAPKTPKKQPTAEELDAELEEYVKSKVASTEGA